MGGLAGANAVPVMYEVHEFAIAVLDFGQFRDDEPQQSATPGATYRTASAKFRHTKVQELNAVAQRCLISPLQNR